ncbi:RNA-binding protein 4F [Mortierella hygrophila]|uniref:RNA-binding protein 4F n=1 Tax=Mortierella hygrophila TaxID=979708 RepID=A0A9P6F3C6_9FUNG|nr:RNA-binding protein 4F [Mortierella hygrophila]
MADDNKTIDAIDNLTGSDDDDFDMDGIEGGDGAHDGPSSETIEAIATFQTLLEANPNQYEAHTQLISLLKGADMFEELREAREAMNKIYPLSEDLWMDWINDEVNMATSGDEKRHVLSLYERATTEYLSIKIWKSYVDYALQEYNESKEYQDVLEEEETVVNAQELNRIFKRADKWTGYHIPESHTIWNVWINFELENLAAQDPASPEDVRRVKKMYLDRIAIPHVTLEDTFSALSPLISKYEPEEYEKTMENCSKINAATRKLLTEREAFEQNLVATGNSVEAFTSYLDYEMRPERRHFARTRTLFERAVAVHCLVPSVWIDYITFLMSMNPQKAGYDLDPKEVLTIAERSTRNCPWSGDLWESRFLLMEMYHKSEEELNALFASALSDATLLASPQELSKVLQARCSYVVRAEKKDEDGKAKIRAAFEHAGVVLESVGGDPYCKIEQFWIEIEAGPLENKENARALWARIESKLKASSESWLARVALEKRLGSPKQARQIFAKACNVAKQIDWPEKVFEAWLLFEREHGTVLEYKDALTRSRAAMKTVELFRAEVALNSAYVDQSAYAVAEPPVPIEESTPAPTKKRKVSFQDEVETFKIPKVEPKPKGKVKEKPDAVAEQTPVKSESSHSQKPLDISAGRHEDTLFVVNFKEDTTAAKLKEMFGEYGTVLRCTMAAPKQGKARYFAYVQMSKPEEAQAALALDGRDVGHRLGLQVRISDTNKASRAPPSVKPPLPKESRHELNVKGLDIDVKDEDLRKLVSLYAEPEHIYAQRQADAKGGTWANIKFHTEADADAAVAMNGLSFQGKTLEVSRRMFKNPEYEGLTRTERRKLKAKKSEEKRAQGGGQDHPDHKTGGKAQDMEMTETTAGESGDKVPAKSSSAATAKSNSTSAKSDSATFAKPAPQAKPMAKLTAMAPRSMQPRSTIQAGKALRARPPRSAGTGTPIGAFKAASTTSTGSSSSGAGETAATGVDGVSGEGAEAAAAPVAPKSNAEFRALMLSGGLKKSRQ